MQGLHGTNAAVSPFPATRRAGERSEKVVSDEEENRNNAGFLMSLIARATAGKMTEEEIGLLKTAYVPDQNVQSSQPV